MTFRVLFFAGDFMSGDVTLSSPGKTGSSGFASTGAVTIMTGESKNGVSGALNLATGDG